MHGRKKSEYKAKQQDPVISSALIKKARQYNTLCNEIISHRNDSVSTIKETTTSSSSSSSKNVTKTTTTTETTLPILEKLLLVNPDPNYLWNYRRELLLKTIEVKISDNNSTSFSYQEELNLTASCLKRNPKAYAVWTYRKLIIHDWVVLGAQQQYQDGKEESKENKMTLLENELKLCADFLLMDERNFHCWNYRRFVLSAISSILSSKKDSIFLTPSDFNGSWKCITKSDSNIIMGPQIVTAPTTTTADDISNMVRSNDDDCKEEEEEEMNQLILKEWDFTTAKIQTNFSNYSAFHYRSKLFPFKIQKQIIQDSQTQSSCYYQKLLEIVQEEIDLLHNAIFTEPDDQTAWWYYRFILTWIAPSSSSSIMKLLVKDEEDDCKRYVNLLDEQCYTSIQELVDSEDGQSKWGVLGLHTILELMIGHCSSNDSDKEHQWREEANDCLKKLMVIDSDRCKRYEYMLQQQ